MMSESARKDRYVGFSYIFMLQVEIQCKTVQLLHHMDS